MSDEPVKTEPSGISEWRWPSVIVLVAALGLVAFIYFIKTPERLVETAGKGAVEVAKVLDDAAAKFRRGNITETFVASLPKLESERGGLLELAKVTATETFRSEDESSLRLQVVRGRCRHDDHRDSRTGDVPVSFADARYLGVIGHEQCLHRPRAGDSAESAAGYSHRSNGEIVERGLGAFQC